MTDYALEGFLVGYEGDRTVSVGTADLVFSYPDSVSTFQYTSGGFAYDDDPLPSAIIAPEPTSLTINGRNVLDDPDAYTIIGQVEWEGNTSYFFDYYYETATRDYDAFFLLGGDPLPNITTPSQFESFTSSITSLTVPSGAYGPGRDIVLADIPDIEITDSAPTCTPQNLVGTDAADTLVGGACNDTIDGAGGNDTLRGGDGSDTINGGDGDDTIFGGATADDRRDVIDGGTGNDTIDAGYGNDLVEGGSGDDELIGGFGADQLVGQSGADLLNGGALSDLVLGGDGDDFVNGGFGYDRINGGGGADRFYHLGVADHGSDWIQDYTAADGDLLAFGNTSASFENFRVVLTETEGAGAAGVAEAFVIYRPTGQIMWALVDGGAQEEINLEIAGGIFDLLV